MAFIIEKRDNKWRAIDIANAQSMEIQITKTRQQMKSAKLCIELPNYSVCIDVPVNLEFGELLKFLMRIKGEPALAIALKELFARFEVKNNGACVDTSDSKISKLRNNRKRASERTNG